MPPARYHAPRRLTAVAPALAVALALAVAVPAPAETNEKVSDPEAVRLAERALAAMGGREAWEATRYLRFDFFGFRLHHWDRSTGGHRLEGATEEGQRYVVLHDVDDRGEGGGEVWLDGARLEGEAAREWLERAYGAWINDTYWLLMPYKLLDPGVHLRHLGQEAYDGVEYDVVELTFGDVGLTPGDRYHAYLHPETGLMDRWSYHLQDWEAERPATHWWWRDWQRHGGILLSPTRVKADDGTVRELGRIAVFDALPAGVFTSPAEVPVE